VWGTGFYELADPWAGPCGPNTDQSLWAPSDSPPTPLVDDLFPFAMPDQYELSLNYPNPFNPETTIPYAVPEAGAGRLTIFDALGQPVRTLVDDAMHAPGYHQVVWDSRDAWGRPAGSGMYFYRLEGKAYVQTRKMLLLH
jgi:hypothetical protein